MIIEVCGPGCPRCHTTKENVRKVLEEMELEEGKEVGLAEIKDPKIMAARGVFMTSTLSFGKFLVSYLAGVVSPT